ncbi:MAG TPA: energy transducer TonB [Pyrinomonadaceae bacterium]|jgi:TonB family protein|nr:energy transducer TonB [Pyrinomonadaceae bacterium]
MKHLTVLVFLILSCAYFQTVSAQAADGWVDVSPKNELFTIQMPAVPPAKLQQNNFDRLNVEGRVYQATRDGIDYAVWSLDNKGYNSNLMDQDAYLDACADVVWDSLLKPLRDQIPKEPGLISQMSYHGELSKVVPGREYLIVLGNKPGLTRFYIAEQQTYVLTVLNAEPTSAGTQRFINSFSLKLPGKQVATSLQEDSSVGPPVRFPPPSGAGSGMGVGQRLPTATLGQPVVMPPSVGVHTGSGIGPGSGNIGGGDRKIVGGETPSGPNGSGTDYNRVFTGREVTAKARVLAKPEPQYTEPARKYAVIGTVILRGVLSSSGEVTGLKVMAKLPHGLTESALRAAREIKFTPAIKDGREVSMYIQLEYNFNLY